MSSYIKLSTSEFPRHIGDIELDPAGAADYAHVEWVEKPEFDPKTQRCEAGPPQQTDGIWYWTWVVRDATPEEIEFANRPFDPLNPFGRFKRDPTALTSSIPTDAISTLTSSVTIL